MDAPYWDNKALPALPHYFICNFLIIFLKINAFLVWFEKGENKFAKRRIRTRVCCVKLSTTHMLPSAPLVLMIVDRLM